MMNMNMILKSLGKDSAGKQTVKKSRKKEDVEKQGRKKQNPGLTEIVFILDRSGSMGGLEKDTIGGFNSMLEKQRRQKGNANITTVLFDHMYEKIHDRVSLSQVKDLTSNEYYVRGCTALLDAVGRTIHEMALIQKHLPKEQKAKKVIFIITTDGLENASREYSRADVKRMIEKEKEKYSWEFIFLGANMDAIAEAQTFGIQADRAVTFHNDSIGIEKNYETVSMMLSDYRASPCMAVNPDWKNEIEKDFRQRENGNSGNS